MTIYGAILGLGWAITALAGLVLVLRHLKALHLTKSEADRLEAIFLGALGACNDATRALTKDLADTNAKLSALSNRVR